MVDRHIGPLMAGLAAFTTVMAMLSPQAGAAQATPTDQAAGHAQPARASAPTRVETAAQATAPAQVKAAPGAQTQWPNRVANFNVCNPIDIRHNACGNVTTFDKPARIAAEIARYKPQVIALEEVCVRQTNAVVDVLSFTYGLTYHVQHNSVFSKASRCAGPGQGGGSAYGSALLSAAPITQAVPHVYRPTNPPSSEPRGYVGVTTQVDGQSVRVFATHLAEGPQGAARQQQVNQLLADAGQFPRAIILGDFNAVPDTPEMRTLGDAGFHDADPACGPFPPGLKADPACKPTHSGAHKKFDYILLKNIEPPGIGVHPTYSDHDLVHADLQLNAPIVITEPDSDTARPLDLPPTVDAGPDARGDEGSAVPLAGSATDDHGAPTVRWSYSPGTDVDSGTTCRFGTPNAARTSFTCTDDGTFTLTLTASDGVNPPVTDTTTVRLRNVAPTLHLTGPKPWSVSRAGQQTGIRATFSDPGSNDTHTCRVGWDGGGTANTFGAADHSCNRDHAFSDPGMFNSSVGVTDDDGGSDTAKVMLIVYDPTAGLLASAGALASPRGALADGPESGTASFAALAKYLTTDSTTPQGTLSVGLPGTDMHLRSTALDWLVITPDGKAALKGSGRVDGKDGFGFLAYVQPGRFRAVVWPLSQGTIPPAAPLYDNRRGVGYDVDQADPQPSSAGLTVIDTGWIPGVPALDGDLAAALRKYAERTPKSLDVHGRVPLPHSGSVSSEARATATTGDGPRDTTPSPQNPQSPPNPSPPRRAPARTPDGTHTRPAPAPSAGGGLLGNLLGLGGS